MSKSTGSLIKISGLLAVISFASRLLGLGRETIIADRFGASAETDAFIFVLSIVTLAGYTVGSALDTTLVPILTKMSQKGENINRLTNSLFNLITASLIFMTILGFFLSHEIVRLFAPGFTGARYLIGVKLFKIMILTVLFNAWQSIAIGILNSKGKFIYVNALGIPYNLIIISVLFFCHGNQSITILAYSITIATFIQFIVMIPSLYRLKYRYSIHFQYNDSKLLEIASLSVPVVLGTAVFQLNSLVDQYVGSMLSTGGITSLIYASRLQGIVYSVIITSISTVVFTQLSVEHSNNDQSKFVTKLRESIKLVTLASIPCVIFLACFRVTIVQFLFEHGAFSSTASSDTASALFWFSLSIIPLGVKEILSRSMYAVKNTKTPMLNGAIGIALNIILNFLFLKNTHMGSSGIALSTTISIFISTALLGHSLKKTLGINIMNKQYLIFGLKSVVAMGFTWLISALLGRLFRVISLTLPEQGIVIFLFFSLVFTVFFIFCWILKLEEVMVVINHLLTRGRRAVIG